MRSFILTALAMAAAAFLPFTAASYCQPGEACWPTEEDVQGLSQSFSISPRILKWNGPTTPEPCGVPYSANNVQPLYGYGMNGMLPVYSDLQRTINSTHPCFSKEGETRDMCFVAIRNTPLEGWAPAIVVWATTANDVAIAVAFARKHNMCIMVAGTGHDFQNRHSCDNAIFIRTALLKTIEVDLDTAFGYGYEGGAMRFGAGLTFSEAHQAAAEHGRYISSGWASTVGIIGWSIGGGHGPFAPSSGLGVDNLLEVELVTADGSLIVANASANSDLFWALRGGGGSTWGVITAVVLRTHLIPPGGFTTYMAVWVGDACKEGEQLLSTLVDRYIQWSLSLGPRWGGLMWVAPTASHPEQCGGNWTTLFSYVFQGPQTEGNATWLQVMQQLPQGFQAIHTYANWWEKLQSQALEPIVPVATMAPNDHYVGSVPSVLVERDRVASGDVAKQVKFAVQQCALHSHCTRQELYHDITGNINSPQDPNVAIPPEFRTAMLHYVAGGWNATDMQSMYYALGNRSYFGESAYDMEQWQQRYWGPNYDKLLRIKQKWDPEGVFWCRHCVGSEA